MTEAPSVLLVVDDEARFRHLAKLKLSGMSVLMASDEDEARKGFYVPPTLVLLDQDLGTDIRGSDICVWMREEHPRVVILALSSSADPSDLEAFRQAGADGYLRKADFSAAISELRLLASGHRITKEGRRYVDVFDERIAS